MSQIKSPEPPQVELTPQSNFMKPNSKKGNKCSKKILGVVLLIIGLIFIGVGFVFGLFLPNTVDSKIRDKTKSCSTNDLPDNFNEPYGDCDTCVPYFTGYHPFNIKNKEDVLNGAKPIVEEKGPYVYRKFTKRINANIDEKENLLTYKQYDTWVFQKDQSCPSCTENDQVSVLDSAFFGVIARAGGEANFVGSIINTVLSSQGLTIGDIEPTLFTNERRAKIMKLFNGLNSRNAPAMLLSLNVIGAVLQIPYANPQVAEGLLIQNLDSVDLQPESAFYGVISTRSITDLAIGYPSFLAGMAAKSFYTDFCVNRGLNDLCKKCQTPEEKKTLPCIQIANACPRCPVIKYYLSSLSSTKFCDDIEASMLQQLPQSMKENVEQFVGATCRKCNDVNDGLFCLAPVPGGVEPTGIDYNKISVNEDLLRPYVQNTGCGNIEKISEFTTYNGIKQTPVWKPSNTDGITTLAELIPFGQNGVCGRADVHCEVVNGGDGSSFPPSGASLSGLDTDTAFDSWNLYVNQASQNLTIFYDKEVRLNNIKLHRYRPSPELLAKTPENAIKGTGLPVRGVQNVAFTKGFPAYVSLPMFANGDKSLIENVQIITKEDNLIKEVITSTSSDFIKYGTYLDIQGSTGRTMNARKRLMASFALPKLSREGSEVMTNLNYPNMKPDIIIPCFWGEEKASATEELRSKFQSIKSLANSFLPVFVSGIIGGLIFIVLGIYLLLKHKREMKNYGELA